MPKFNSFLDALKYLEPDKFITRVGEDLVKRIQSEFSKVEGKRKGHLKYKIDSEHNKIKLYSFISGIRNLEDNLDNALQEEGFKVSEYETRYSDKHYSFEIKNEMHTYDVDVIVLKENKKYIIEIKDK